jgi:hypothetical protein
MSCLIDTSDAVSVLPSLIDIWAPFDSFASLAGLAEYGGIY